MKSTWIISAILVAVLIVLTACSTATPADHGYVTSYEVVGDRSVKYIYLPGVQSRAGGAYLDQALALEICTLKGGRQAREVEEWDCKMTRVLNTEEYR